VLEGVEKSRIVLSAIGADEVLSTGSTVFDSCLERNFWGMRTWGRSLLTSDSGLSWKFDGSVIWTSLGPLLRWVPRPTTRWAPGTTQLGLHGTCWRGAQGLQRDSTRLGSYTCPYPCKVHD
jgi:hypothetical protein